VTTPDKVASTGGAIQYTKENEREDAPASPLSLVPTTGKAEIPAPLTPSQAQRC
jgi:hypothetical protein